MKGTRNRRSKQQQSAKQSKAQPPARVVKQTVTRVGVGLDRAALDWAALLKDPCNAKLALPCYPVGNGSSVLMRFETDIIYANSATEVATFGFWAPGIGVGFGNSTALTTDVLGSVLGQVSGFSPGSVFLGNNVTSARAVAGCVQITYPGTELNRSGIVGIGVVPAETFQVNLATAYGGGNINTSAAAVRTLSQHVERMPSTTVECKWFPGENDAVPFDPKANPVGGLSAALAGRNAIAWSASGFPVSTGVRFRFVVVYELNIGQDSTGANQGVVQSLVPPVSLTTPAAVLRALYNKDPQWYLESAVKAGKAVGQAISYAKQGAKLAGQVIGGIGMLMA